MSVQLICLFLAGIAAFNARTPAAETLVGKCVKRSLGGQGFHQVPAVNGFQPIPRTCAGGGDCIFLKPCSKSNCKTLTFCESDAEECVQFNIVGCEAEDPIRPASSPNEDSVIRSSSKSATLKDLSTFGSTFTFFEDEMIVGDPNSGSGTVEISRLDRNRRYKPDYVLNPLSVNDVSFGFCVSAGGSFLLVGSPMAQNDVGVAVGKVTTFHRSKSGAWMGATYLSEPSELRAKDEFGYSVATGLRYSVVGSPGYDGLAMNMGKAFVYVAGDDGRLDMISELLPPNSYAEAACGTSVSLHGLLVAIGCPGKNQVLVYGALEGQFIALDALSQSSGQFGYSVSVFATSDGLIGSKILVGAPEFNDHRGAAFIYNYESELAGFTLQDQLSHNDDSTDSKNQHLGSSVSISHTGSFVAVGVPDHRGEGLAIVYSFEGAWKQVLTSKSLPGESNGEHGLVVQVEDHYSGSFTLAASSPSSGYVTVINH